LELCFRRDPEQRPGAAMLLQHPFITSSYSAEQEKEVEQQADQARKLRKLGLYPRTPTPAIVTNSANSTTELSINTTTAMNRPAAAAAPVLGSSSMELSATTPMNYHVHPPKLSFGLGSDVKAVLDNMGLLDMVESSGEFPDRARQKEKKEDAKSDGRPGGGEGEFCVESFLEDVESSEPIGSLPEEAEGRGGVGGGEESESVEGSYGGESSGVHRSWYEGEVVGKNGWY